RPQGDARGPAGPRDPGPAWRPTPAVRGVLDGVPNGRRTPRQRAEALRGERATGGTGPGAVRTDHGRRRWRGLGGTRTRARWFRVNASLRHGRHGVHRVRRRGGATARGISRLGPGAERVENAPPCAT